MAAHRRLRLRLCDRTRRCPGRRGAGQLSCGLCGSGEPGQPVGTYTPGTAKVLTEVKGIKWEVVGDASKPGAMIPVISDVEGLLAPFLTQPAPGILVV